MPDLFDRLVDPLIGREGGYSNHPSDRGGETMWGITIDVARRFGYSGPMREMPRTAAIEIYRRRYWTGPGFDDVATLAPAVAEEMFDTGVNMGPKVAAEFLQRLLNGLNREGRDYTDIVADGDVGPATLRALSAYLRARGGDAVPVLLRGLNALQGERFVRLSEGRPKNEDFLFGWLRTRVGVLA